MFILASSSPRRKQLMNEEITKDFKIIVSDIDEEKFLSDNPIDSVKEIAKQKGLAVLKDHQNDVVISADTIVVIDNKIIGKPKDKADAFRMLKMLSNRKHEVITAYAIFYQNNIILQDVHSDVIFNKLSDDFILRYIETGSPLDKAGAYGVQDKEFQTVKQIIGSVNNVIGFPTENIKKDLTELGLL